MAAGRERGSRHEGPSLAGSQRLATPRAVSRVAQSIAVAAFEVRQQFHEPLTTLYGLVLLLLATGFTGAAGVELVSDRGSVPRTSEWSLWLAFGGLTAFGQVITTMVAVTAVLRDDATRMSEVLATSGLSARTWLAGRLLAASLVLTLVYVAIPVGVAIGAALVDGAATAPTVARRAASVFVVLTMPTTLTVALAIGVCAALTRRVLGALIGALALVGLWQLSLVLEASASTRVLGALLDPFGNAPVLAETRDWDAAARAEQPVPWRGLVLQNRLIWMTVGLLVAAVGLWRVRWSAGGTKVAKPKQQRMLRTGPERIGPFRSIAQFTSLWIRADGAWRIVASLAAANALLNAVFTAPPPGNDLHALAETLSSIREHARVFFILLATVYAGELVWRDRDVGIDALMNTMPVSSRVASSARLVGLASAQWQVVAMLAVGAVPLLLWRSLLTSGSAIALWAAWAVFHLWLPFLQWTALSVAVHTVVQHKVGAHLLLITGWVVAVVLDGSGADGWWYRYAEPAPLLSGSGLAWMNVVLRGAYWTAVAAALAVVPTSRR